MTVSIRVAAVLDSTAGMTAPRRAVLIALMMATTTVAAAVTVRIAFADGRRRAGRSATALLRQQDPTDALVDRLELREVWRRNLDRVPGHR